MDFDGNTLRSKRESAGVTQAEVAAYLGYFTNGVPNRSAVSNMENGHQPINKRLSLALTNYFKDKGFD